MSKSNEHGSKKALKNRKKLRLEEIIMDITEETLVECTCCCDEYPGDLLTICNNGHLACQKCVKTHAENLLFTLANHNITCITCVEPCDALYSDAALATVLSTDGLNKYGFLKTMAEYKMLSIDGMDIRMCKHCGSGIDVGEYKNNVTVMTCLGCDKKTCMLCNENEHNGRECYEDPSVEKHKHSIEEKLTEALIVKCHKCRTAIMKETGCNKMTCVCGAHMCYLCKKAIRGYDHFCNVPLCNGETCGRCHTFSDIKKTLHKTVDGEDEYAKKLIKEVEQDKTQQVIDPFIQAMPRQGILDRNGNALVIDLGNGLFVAQQLILEHERHMLNYEQQMAELREQHLQRLRQQEAALVQRNAYMRQRMENMENRQYRRTKNNYEALKNGYADFNVDNNVIDLV